MNWHKKHRWMLKLLSDLMTPSEREQQRRDFVYGNAVLSNPNVTREKVDVAAERMEIKDE